MKMRKTCNKRIACNGGPETEGLGCGRKSPGNWVIRKGFAQEICVCSVASVMSDSLRPHGL